MRKYFLRKGEGEKILADLLKNFKKNDFFKENPRVEAIELQANEMIILVDNHPFIVKRNDKTYPSLIFYEALNKLPKVAVDMGAIPHICNGADVMAPGIKKIEGSFEPGSLVVVIDEKYAKPIAIGDAIVSSKFLAGAKHGKAIKNAHYVGDRFWKVIKEFKQQ
ncbi:MAG: DUF1947 domain-containing protein [Candidatus Bathyarchaeia archaeon]